MTDPYNHDFNSGDRVRQSARFLRSLGTVNFGTGNSGLTTNDYGSGVVIEILGDLVNVWFADRKLYRTFNRNNLIHETDTFNEAQRAEHDRNYFQH